MNYRFAAALAALFLFFACHQTGFVRYDNGLRYRLISHGQGDNVRAGETLKMQVRQLYGDSVLSNSRETVPVYQVYDSLQLTPASWQILGKLRKGDSVVFEALVDSLFRDSIPSFVRRGEWLQTQIVVEEIFGVAEDWKSDLRRYMEKERPANSPMGE